MLEELKNLSQHFLTIKGSSYQRYLIKKAPFTHRFSILLGQRGVGKTTTIIQHLLAQVDGNKLSPMILYIQTDHFLMSNTSLYDVAEQFHNMGGKIIAFDEIHKYPNWSGELKSIYDTFPDLTILASGSSALEIHKGTHDLSRRAIVHTMLGMSFREFLELNFKLSLPVYSLNDILKYHERITNEILTQIENSKHKILPLFKEYLKYGYYPYLQEVKDRFAYSITLEQNIHTTIEADLAAIYPQLTGNSIKKIKELLVFIAKSVPFTPNWNKLKTIIDVGDVRTLKTYFKYLEDASLIQTITKSSNKMNTLELPEKIYLDNPNQIYAIAADEHNIGTIRETFFLNMLSQAHDVNLPRNGDLLVDKKFLFEIGGRKKDLKQIYNDKNAYLACDEIERGVANKIPLWLFGFLY